MLELQGLAVSPGVAIGKALILDREGYRITRSQIHSSDRSIEIQRLRSAIADAAARLDAHRQRSSRQLGQQVGAIFSAHQQVLMDPSLHREWTRLIEDSCYSAEWAVSTVLSRYAQAFRSLGNSLMAERVNDIRDVERTLLEALGGAPLTDTEGDGDSVLLSHDLTPAETANLDRGKVIAFCTEGGGPSDHTAIVARGMELPAVVGLGSFLHRVDTSAMIIVDGFAGHVILQPDQQTLERYRRTIEARDCRVQELNLNRDLPAQLTDGTRVRLMANIEFPAEVSTCVDRGAEGIGLYRTEFLYLGSDRMPSEQQLTESYQGVIQASHGQPVVMRTLDLGADKIHSLAGSLSESNPFLGLRSIRLSLRQPELFRTQLRAMLRAACCGDLWIMFPMISTLGELRAARRLLQESADQLSREGVRLPERIPVGMMIEVPAAALLLDRFIREVDFISIGTNDLIQYTMAVDRGNEYVADLYSGYDPAVLRLIRQAVQVAVDHDVEVSVCGEMSSDPLSAVLLVGLGVRTLSAPPAALPQVKHTLRRVSLEHCQRLAGQAMEFETAAEVESFLAEQLRTLVPAWSTET